SILGDKTRMELLARNPAAFIRPSPSQTHLGGVARRTREVVSLCEAAGFDLVLIETVGVGQSETMVAGMVDCFALLQLPNAGDDLQAIKKGIMEIADLIAINKAEIDPIATNLAVAQFKSALHLLHPSAPGWTTPVVPCSALRKQGVEEFWSQVIAFEQHLNSSGELVHRRQRQAVDWFWSIVNAGLRALLEQDDRRRTALATALQQVEKGLVSPGAAAHDLLMLLSHGKPNDCS
ncbi:MAG TPA: methylmalonyl Co-A mutase-associated GTPase MeaB, partial [Gammaproteobacteria bacterium]|nr:methylmalonyl Co-A mutase-associated GTPase MeaB [Gammaproteobacteria bacterium]